MEYKFYLVYVKHTAIEDETTAPTTTAAAKTESDIPKIYLRVQSLIEFDTFTATHGPGTIVDGMRILQRFRDQVQPETNTYFVFHSETGSNKRKNSIMDCSTPPAKLQKTIYPAYFIPELAHVVAMCDEKLPFIALAAELSKRKLAHSGLQVEANSTSLVIKLLALPMPDPPKPSAGETSKAKVVPTIDKVVWNALTKRLLSVALRKQVKSNHSGHWTAELIFYETPLKSKHHREQGQRRPVYFQYDLGTSETVGKTVDSLLDDWSRIVYLYPLVHDFAEQFKNGKSPPQSSAIEFELISDFFWLPHL